MHTTSVQLLRDFWRANLRIHFDYISLALNFVLDFTVMRFILLNNLSRDPLHTSPTYLTLLSPFTTPRILRTYDPHQVIFPSCEFLGTLERSRIVVFIDNSKRILEITLEDISQIFSHCFHLDYRNFTAINTYIYIHMCIEVDKMSPMGPYLTSSRAKVCAPHFHGHTAGRSDYLHPTKFKNHGWAGPSVYLVSLTT